jgi:hypothetical protein
MTPRTVNRRRLGLAGALAALLALGNAGCIVFERQTVALAFTPDGKDVHALIVYEGLHVRGEQAQDLERAERDLAALAGGKQTFYLGFWGGRVWLEDEPADYSPRKDVQALLRRHITVEVGYFFDDGEGRLCYAQPVVIRDVPALVVAANRMISAAVTDELEGAAAQPVLRPAWMDEETLGLLRRASGADGYPWLAVEPGRLSFSMPIGPEAFRGLKREALLPRSLPKDAEQARFLSDLPLSLDHRSDRVTVSVGLGGGRPLVVPFPPDAEAGPATHDVELFLYARTLPAPYKGEMKVGEAIADFLRTAAR